MKTCCYCGGALPEPFYYVNDLRFCSKHCAMAYEFKKSGGAAPIPPTPDQVLTGILNTLKEQLTIGSKDAKQLESLRASLRIVEKQKLVLNHENKRLYAKVRDLDGLCAEQIEYIEELERKVIQEDDNPSYIAELHKILDEKDKEIKELREEVQSLKSEKEGWKVFATRDLQNELNKYKARCQDYERNLNKTEQQRNYFKDIVERAGLCYRE